MTELSLEYRHVLAAIADSPTGCTIEDLGGDDDGDETRVRDMVNKLRRHGLVRPALVWSSTRAGREALANRDVPGNSVHELRVNDPITTLPTSTDLVTAAQGIIVTSHAYAHLLRAMFVLANIGDWINPDSIWLNSGEEGSLVLSAIGIDDDQLLEYVTTPLVAVIDRAAPDIDGIGAAVATVASTWRDGRWTGSSPAEQAAFTSACRAYDDLVHSSKG